MKSSGPNFAAFHLQKFNATIARNENCEPAAALALTADKWEQLNGYPQSFGLAQDPVLIKQGPPACTLYLVESGTLSLHRGVYEGRMRLALVGAASVPGEGVFSPLCLAKLSVPIFPGWS